MELSRIDYLILSALYSSKAVTPLLGATIKELEITDVQRSCKWKHLKFLVENGLVCKSGNFGKDNMYYITKSGIDMIGGQPNEK